MKIALIGNQNSGKSTLFNNLTGSHQKIANWPGVTIEKKEGKINNTSHFLIDLPGIYSLNYVSVDEQITCDYIKNNNIDLIINVIDVTTLRRGLYLNRVINKLGIDVIVVLNMMDKALKAKLSVNSKTLQEKLKNTIIENNNKNSIEEIISCINKKSYIKNASRGKSIDDSEKAIIKQYAIVDEIYRSVIKKGKTTSITDKIDKIVLNKYLAIPIFLLIMFFMYFISLSVIGNTFGNILSITINDLKNAIRLYLNNLNVKSWIVSLLCDSLISSSGYILSFLPQLLSIFFIMNVLEASGYMARVAFILDNIFARIGLSGKSIIPFIIGSGCSIPAIMSCRVIEDENYKKKTIALTSLIPCSAKLPIIVLFSSTFFNHSALVAMSFYILSIVIIIVASLIIKMFFKYKEKPFYLLELPQYNTPKIFNVLTDVYKKIINYIKKAFSTIFVCSFIMWLLISFDINGKYCTDINNSLLAIIGNKLSFLFYPMCGNYSWELTISALQGLIAKEQVVTSLNVIANMKSKGESFSLNTLPFLTPSSSYAFCCFNLFTSPCIGAIATIKKELCSIKKTVFILLIQTTCAFLFSYLIYFLLL